MCSIIARGTLTLNDQEEKIVPWYIWVGIVSYALVHLGCALLAFLILEDAFEIYPATAPGIYLLSSSLHENTKFSNSFFVSKKSWMNVGSRISGKLFSPMYE